MLYGKFMTRLAGSTRVSSAITGSGLSPNFFDMLLCLDDPAWEVDCIPTIKKIKLRKSGSRSRDVLFCVVYFGAMLCFSLQALSNALFFS